MSQLDAACAAAKKNKEQKAQFYNAFLNTELFIPTHAAADTDQNTAADESISPMFVESDGVKYLMLFDSRERLVAWAKKEVAYAALPGHVVVEMMGVDVHWALNAGTEYVKTFVPDEIQWLKNTVAQAKDRATDGAENISVLIRKPASLAEGLMESLSNALSNHNEIERAYLGLAIYAIKGEEPHLTLVVEIADQAKASMDTIRSELTAAAKSILDEAEHFDVLMNGESFVANEISKAIEAFYVRSE